MIGNEGYRKVFKGLEILVKNNIKNQSLRGISYNLLNDFFIAPISVNTRDDIAFGEIMKFDNVTTVVGTLSDVEKYVSKGGDSSKKYKYRYVFDFKKHILAIELKKALPTTKVFVDFLETTLDKHINDNFPEYTLKIIEMTDAESLSDVINKANSFKRVDVEITFSNSAEWDDAITAIQTKSLEDELRNKNIHSSHTIEKSDKDTSMTEPTTNTMTKLALACKYGNASITYNDDDGRKTYKMAKHPIKLAIKDATKKKPKTILEFALDVKASILTASTLATKADSVYKKIRKGLNHESENQ